MSDAVPAVMPALAADDLRPEGSPLTRTRRALPELHGALRACAEHVLAHAWELRGRSVQDLALGIGVSTHAVNRFTRRLGYPGYRAFSHALAMELGRLQGAAYTLPEPLAQALEADPTVADDPTTLVSRAFALELSALRDTWHSLGADTIRRAVTALARAERILFVATGAGVGVVHTASFHFCLLGFTANWSADPATTIAQIHLLNPGDVVVGFSLHGASLTIVEALEQARQRGLTTLGITSTADSAVSRAADVPIVVFGGEEVMAFGQFASRAAAATLLDALASAVAWEKRDVSVPHAREVTRTNQRLHSAFSRHEP